MNHNILGNHYSPTILVAKDRDEKLGEASQVLASSNQVCVLVVNATAILSWIQQHQPDLIILDIEWSKIVDTGLITALKLDWLTRNIPILLISNLSRSKICSQGNLDYDICLTKPYSIRELEQAICSLVSSPVCKTNFIKAF